MIDVHSHILPHLDDGAASVEESVAMARMAVADGISTIACTPHMQPGVFDNSAEEITRAIADLSEVLQRAEINLILVSGADVHMAPGIATDIASGRILPLNGSRYFLLEPTHDVVPPKLEPFVLGLVNEGYMPIITHPERLLWIERHFDIIDRLAEAGIWMQLTAGSLLGSFGRRARYWAERMLDMGVVQLLATDAHNTKGRPPLLSGARDVVRRRLGEAEAEAMVWTRPLGVLQNAEPSTLTAATCQKAG